MNPKEIGKVKFTNTDTLVIKFLGIFPRGGYANGISSVKSNLSRTCE